MAFHLGLYSSSIAVATTLTQVVAVADPVLAPAGSGLLVNAACPRILRVIGVGNLLIRAQLTSGSLRDFAPFDISPINVGTIIGSPARIVDFKDNPLTLQVNEELDAFISNSGAGATVTSVAVIFSDGAARPVIGRIFTVRFTVTAALVAATWSANTPVFDNGLPSGTFALVGSRMRSATGLFHRYIPRGGPSLRPGTVMGQAADDFEPRLEDRNGGLGEWMRFTNTTPPQVEAFALAADAAAGVAGFMDLIQVG
jgi:hypothetical protein